MQFALDLIIAVVGLFAVCQFMWGMRYHFKNERVPAGVKIVSTISGLTVLLYLYLQFAIEQPAPAQLAGLACAVASSALFVWAVRASRQAGLRYVFEGADPGLVLKDGPYNHVRHPFYTSYVLLWAGWGLATWSPIAILPVSVLTMAYVLAARDEEQRFAASPMASDYASYKSRTGFFWPRIIR
jgi:protein-S-isoprenylcysteine O-methyltransferase Ste14